MPIFYWKLIWREFLWVCEIQKFPILNLKDFWFQSEVQLYSPTSPEDKNYENVLVKTTLNFCKFSEGFFGNLFLKPVLEATLKYSNLTIKCPIRKNAFYIRNLQIFSLDIPISRYKFLYKEKMFGFLMNESKKRILCRNEIYGEYRRKWSLFGWFMGSIPCQKIIF